LQRGRVENPNDRLAELLAFATGTFPEGHPFKAIVPMPSDVELPPIWMLGSTLEGASIAAQLGVRYAFAGHFAMRNAAAAMAWYRDHFQPSAALARPYAMLAITVVCGEDDAHAERLAAPIRLAVVRNRTGRRAPIASIDEALAYQFTAEEQAIADDFLMGAIIGGPERVAIGLGAIARDTGADELMMSTLIPDLTERVRSCERVSRMAGLS
jgi:luciferase family oxidoreductase group 1